MAGSNQSWTTLSCGETLLPQPIGECKRAVVWNKRIEGRLIHKSIWKGVRGSGEGSLNIVKYWKTFYPHFKFLSEQSLGTTPTGAWQAHSVAFGERSPKQSDFFNCLNFSTPLHKSRKPYAIRRWSTSNKKKPSRTPWWQENQDVSTILRTFRSLRNQETRHIPITTRVNSWRNWDQGVEDPRKTKSDTPKGCSWIFG